MKLIILKPRISNRQNNDSTSALEINHVLRILDKFCQEDLSYNIYNQPWLGMILKKLSNLF